MSVPSTTLAHVASVWPCLYRCLYYDIFLLVLGLFAWDYWPIFSVACHLTSSSLRGGCAVVLMLPWFDGSLVWSKYSVVDPTYKAIAVAGYLCISVRWIIYHIDTLGSCHLPWWFSSDQQFSFWWQICGFYMLQWCSSFMIIFLVPVWGNICIVLGYLTWPHCQDPTHIISSCIS